MKKINKHIEIARTTRGKYSSMGSKACARIQAALSLRYEHVGVTIVNDLSDLEELMDRRPDLVFLGLKRLPNSGELIDETGNDIWVSEYLDQAGISYTGAMAGAIKLDFNKEKAKAHVRLADLPTAQSFVSIPDQHSTADSLPLPFPLFIKPLNGGGGRGVGADSVVRTFAEFQGKVESIQNINGSSSLVEQYLDGREFSVAIIDGYGLDDPLVMPIEIITTENSRGDRILGSTVKTEDHELVVTISDAPTHMAVSALATDAYKALGGRDLGRIDIRMDAQGKVHFLEANFMPAPGTRYFAGAFEINGSMAYEELIFNITELALSRNHEQRNNSDLRLAEKRTEVFVCRA